MGFFRRPVTWLLLLAIALILIGCFGYLMYRKDMQTIANFSAAYQSFDTSMASFASGVGDASSTANALLALSVHADTFRLSSLIKNDAILDAVARDVSQTSQNEFDAFNAYDSAVQNHSTDQDSMAQSYHRITAQRKEAYAHFRELLQ
jgi:NADH:ubiquinone oxidoreductase subunit K